MGKITGFLEYARKTSQEIKPLERIKNYKEFHIPISSEEQQTQAARCMDCGVPFCQSGLMIGGMTSGCPLHNLIPEWNDLVYTNNWQLALKRLFVTNRFPEFTSRVCPAPCEAACTCSLTNSSVSVKENEYAIIEKAYENNYIEAKEPPIRTGKTVAVVGSGPAGLATAEWLNKRGHNVTVFERSDRLGGLLMYGIPNMKLEKWTIDRRVKVMQKEGVKFVTNCNIGIDKTASELEENFDAVVLCCGASKARDITANGRDAKGIYYAVDYLSGVTKSLLDSELTDGKAIDTKDKNVIVIGGGDTGNDCVGSAIRQGCKSVLQLEMMPKPPTERTSDNAWPQWPRTLKTDYGQQESIAVFGKDPREYQTTVSEYLKDDNGNLTGVVISKLTVQKDNRTGRTTMIPTGHTFTVDADYVFLAAGFVGCEKYIAEAFDVNCDARGNIDTTKYKTSKSKVFSAGDMRRGQSLVV